jgi:uncharacterized membrane protein YccC
LHKVYVERLNDFYFCDTGATLSKGLNRGLGTLTAGGLALAVAESARHIGNLDTVFLIICTFVVGE